MVVVFFACWRSLDLARNSNWTAISRVAKSQERSLKMALFQCLNFSSSSFLVRFNSLVFLHLSKLEFCDSFEMKAIFNINSNRNRFIYRNLTASSAWQDLYKYPQWPKRNFSLPVSNKFKQPGYENWRSDHLREKCLPWKIKFS